MVWRERQRSSKRGEQALLPEVYDRMRNAFGRLMARNIQLLRENTNLMA
jgi:hypothetical protein